MPQIFQVLRCYKCLIFQIHQTKKLNKWECKLCGEKQSHKRHYGIGTAKECRFHVQKLNSLHGNINEQNNSTESDKDFENNVKDPKETLDLVQSQKASKWDDYMDKFEHNMVEFVEEENMFIDDKKVVFELPKKRKKLTGIDHYKNKNTKLNSSSHTNAINHNAEKDINISTPRTENDNIILNQQEKKTSTRKFVPPKINVNSKWAQFNEESKSKDKEIINNSICNTFTLNNIEIKNTSNDSKAVHTSETIKPKTTTPNIHSKWTKFTEDDNFGKNKFESSLNKNSGEYGTNPNNTTFNYINSSEHLLDRNICLQNISEHLFDKNVCLQNISNNMKNSIVTSLFDDGDLDVLDIWYK